jgi:hypothetical protein
MVFVALLQEGLIDTRYQLPEIVDCHQTTSRIFTMLFNLPT